ncbi:Universal stress A-like protein [Nymphaea thermarum]|nr:Universal stress A-like protein [Nymphaea thermarum]
MVEESPTRIMVGVNESTVKGYPYPSISSRNAFDWVIKKIVRPRSPSASHFKLLFLHVQVTDEDGFDDMDSVYASPDDFRDIRHRDKVRGLHLLEYFVSRCHELGVSCEAWMKQGDPKEVVCSEIKRVQPDLLVVGSRGLGPFQRVFVGTVSEFCTKHADCPVVVIKRKVNETPEDPVDD